MADSLMVFLFIMASPMFGRALGADRFTEAGAWFLLMLVIVLRAVEQKEKRNG